MANNNAVKPGYKTSEAGMTLLFTTLDIMQQMRAESTNTMTSLTLHVLTGLVIITYIWGRAKVKSSQNGSAVALETIELLLRQKYGLSAKPNTTVEAPAGPASITPAP